jgi:hypothetical protein
MASSNVTAPQLFEALVDDAGLFPPEELAMPAALARHADELCAASPVLSERFICPASRLGELREALGEAEPISLSITGAAGPEMADWVSRALTDDRLAIVSVEVARGARADDIADLVAALRPQLARLDVYVELPLGPRFAEAVDQLAVEGWRAKLRCGGDRPELFPSAVDLASAFEVVTARGLPFKATAGLHHAVRYTDSKTGFTHHGFLNLIVALSRALTGATHDELVTVLESVDGAGLAEYAGDVEPALASQVRAHLVSFGSCSTSQPVIDLVNLGLVAPK